MKNLRNLITAAILSGVLALAGCSSKNASNSPNTAKQQTAAVTETKKTLSINEGINNMRNVLKEMKGKLEAKDEDSAVKVSAQLEENWGLIEDGVKDKNKELYNKVEDPLHTINAAVKVKPLDTKVLKDSIDSLDTVLVEVQKLK